MTALDVLVGLAVLVGVLGVLVPVLPGGLLIVVAVLVWAVQGGTVTAWTVFAVVVALLATGTIVKYAVPGRNLKAAGVPNRTLVLGGLLGLVGFFVVPVIGLFIGFVLGVYLAEVQRVGRDDAWPSTKHALKAAGLSILIELGFGTLAALCWATGVIAT